MTVTSEISEQDYIGDGVTTVFPFTIQSQEESWIFGFVGQATESGVVFLNEDQETSPGGTFTFDVAPPALVVVTIFRNVPGTQGVDYPEYGPFPARNNEDAVDKLTMAVAQLFNRYEGGEIFGDVNFRFGITMRNNRALRWENFNGVILPTESGVYRMLNDGANTYSFQYSDGLGAFLDAMTITPNGQILFANNIHIGTQVDANDATRKDYVDAADNALQVGIDGKVNKSGDTMTGDLTLNERLIISNIKPIVFENDAGGITPSDDNVHRILKKANDDLVIQKTDGAGNWDDVIVIQAAADLVAFAYNIAVTQVAPTANNQLTRKDYVDIADTALQGNINAVQAEVDAAEVRITTNEGDIASNDTDITALQNSKVSLDGSNSAMSGDLTLYNVGLPDTGSSATSRQYVQDLVNSIIAGLTFLGGWDASTNTNPPAGVVHGEFYIIIAAGLLDLSVNNVPPPGTPTIAVVAGDKIIWDGDPARLWWSYIPNFTGNALSIQFDATGLNYLSTNVQDALAEADTDMFVHARGTVADIIGGNKTWIGTQLFNNGITLQWMGVAGLTNGIGNYTVHTAPSEETIIRKFDSVAVAQTVSVIGLNGDVEHRTEQKFTGPLLMGNNVHVRFENQDPVADQIGQNRIINNVNNDLLHQAFVVDNGTGAAGWLSVMTIGENGNLNFGGGLQQNTFNSLTTFNSSTNFTGTATFNGNINSNAGATFNGSTNHTGPLLVRQGAAPAGDLSIESNAAAGTGIDFNTGVPRIIRGAAVAALFDVQGSAMTSAFAVVTREKGDARYGQLAGGNIWTSAQQLINNTSLRFLGFGDVDAGMMQQQTLPDNSYLMRKNNLADDAFYNILDVSDVGAITLGHGTATHTIAGTWTFTGANNVFNQTVKCVAPPVAVNDLTRKDYVDTKAQVLHHPDEATALAASVGDLVNLHVWDIV